MKNFNLSVINCNELSAVESIAKTFIKGAASQIVIRKSCDDNMNKGRGANRNPYLGRISKVEVYGGFQLGTDYLKSVTNAMVRSGSETEEFRSAESWHVYYNDFFQTDKKTRSKFYLKIQVNEAMSHRIDSVYYLDGEVLSENELASIKASWWKKSSKDMPKTQQESGITEGHRQHYMLLSLANIVSIAQGAKMLTLSEVAVPSMVAN